MSKYRRLVATLGVVAGVGMALAAGGPAQADWHECPDDPGHVAYNPLTGGSMRVGHIERFFGASNQLTWAWACVDDGGVTGAHSVGTAGYHTADATQVHYLQHNVFCMDIALPYCTQTTTGAAVYGIAAGPGGGGATACTSLGVTYYSPCQDVRVGIGTTPPATTATGSPSSGLCGVDVNSTCTLKEATVTVGGTTVSADAAGAVPASRSETVPGATVCINQGGISAPVKVRIPPSPC